jgi:hypothetical protein
MQNQNLKMNLVDHLGTTYVHRSLKLQGLLIIFKLEELLIIVEEKLNL